MTANSGDARQARKIAIAEFVGVMTGLGITAIYLMAAVRMLPHVDRYIASSAIGAMMLVAEVYSYLIQLWIVAVALAAGVCTMKLLRKLAHAAVLRYPIAKAQ